MILDILIALIMLFVSAYALCYAVNRITFIEFYFWNAFKAIFLVEVAVFLLQQYLIVYGIVISFIVMIMLGFLFIYFIVHVEFEEAIKIFLIWIILRIIIGIVIGVIFGLVFGLVSLFF